MSMPSDFEPNSLVDRFRARLEDQIAEIVEVFGQTPLDLADLGDKAHRLAGGSGQLGLRRLSLIASMIDQIAAGTVAANGSLSVLERRQLDHLIDEIGRLKITAAVDARSLIFFGLAPELAHDLLDALETGDLLPEIGEDRQDLDDFRARSPDGLIATGAPLEDAESIPNPIVVLSTPRPRDLSTLSYDIVISEGDPGMAIRLAMAALQIPPPVKLHLEGFDPGLRRGLEILIDRHCDTTFCETPAIKGCVTLCPGDETIYGDDRLTLGIPIDPLVGMRLINRVARHRM
ncbi:MAG: Hpt domain-containing protein [Alphaproteobacteria bacterium]|nr:Hpt domain-containing protein [Alphaproteobacteria bacterium]